MNKNVLICRNCGKLNHHIKNCFEPKTSFGVILYKYIDRTLNILLIRRRNTIGFVQFIRGQYKVEKIDYIQKLFNVMSDHEISLLSNHHFLSLWRYLWNLSPNADFTPGYDYRISLKKFNALLDLSVDGSLNSFIHSRHCNFAEQEWGFPKGRKNRLENNSETAIREFTEETGIPNTQIKVVNKKFTEHYISYDDIEYKNVYFLAKYIGDDRVFEVSSQKEQISEVSAIKFFPIKDAITTVREYSKKKREVIQLVEKYVLKYL